MPQHTSGFAERIVAFIDLGTNSVRLLVVRVNPNQSWNILTQQKEMIRLGESEFADQRLHPEAMERSLIVCRRFAEMARSQGADEVVAVATAATREALNKGEFLRRFQEETGFPLHIISGREEARLIYLGVSSGVHLEDREALFIDIGGGSTELSVGNQREFHYLDSLKLGAIRLTTLFLAGYNGPVSPALFARIQQYVREVSVRAVQHLRDYSVDQVLGSSGTIETVANVAALAIQKREPERNATLTRRDVDDVVRLLCELPLEERRRVPGMNPARADIIVAGMAILSALMDELRVTQLTTSDRGLRDGLLVDYLAQHVLPPEVTGLSVRARGVLQLGRLCGYDERHAEHVTALSLSLFDSALAAGLHTLGAWERELLMWAARLHDIGMFLNFGSHQVHSHYFIRNADLLGFDQREIAIIAATAFFHRKTMPRKKHPEFNTLDAEAQQTVRLLSLFLRVAESLDRGHSGVVQRAAFRLRTPKKLLLEYYPADGSELEISSVRNHRNSIQKTLGLPITFACADKP